MRLSDIERKGLAHALAPIVASSQFFLFGSRTNPNAKGGDIDVVIYFQGSGAVRHKIAREVTTRFQMVCEQKIDVLVVDPNALSSDEKVFLATITLHPFTIAEILNSK